MRRLLCVLGLVVLSGALTDLGAQARGRANADSRDRGNGSDTRVDANVHIVFGDGELGMIRAWFGDSHNLQGLPPGLAKRDSLPPGLQRQLQRNGTLPPGLEKRQVYNVPDDLSRRLPTLISGISRVIVGGNILLVDDRTQVILDIAAIF